MSAAPCQHGVPWTAPCAECILAAKARTFTLTAAPGFPVPGVARATITQAPVSTAGSPQVVMADTGGVTVPQADDTAGHGAPIVLHLQPSDLQAGFEAYPVPGNPLATMKATAAPSAAPDLLRHRMDADSPDPEGWREARPAPRADPSPPPPADLVNHPTHYKVKGLPECIEVIEKLGLGYHAGNALKYLWRAGKKDGAPKAQDYRKAANYLNRLADLEEGKAGKPGVR